MLALSNGAARSLTSFWPRPTCEGKFHQVFSVMPLKSRSTTRRRPSRRLRPICHVIARVDTVPRSSMSRQPAGSDTPAAAPAPHTSIRVGLVAVLIAHSISKLTTRLSTFCSRHSRRRCLPLREAHGSRRRKKTVGQMMVAPMEIWLAAGGITAEECPRYSGDCHGRSFLESRSRRTCSALLRAAIRRALHRDFRSSGRGA